MPTAATATGERRASRRFRRVGPCRVQVFPGYSEFVGGLTWDVSSGGIAFVLPRQVPAGIPVIIERALGVPASPILAKVVRSWPLEFGWLHGAKLRSPLTEEELAVWLS